MLKDSDFELTLDESQLLIVAAKLFAVAREYSVWPPQSEHEVNYWNEKVKEELVCFLPVACIFGLILPFIRVPLTVSMADYGSNDNKIHLHPVAQIFGKE